MENASKALIIAGAILLSILIIGLGMAVYNNSSSSKGAADLSAEQQATHNQSFTSYEGKINGDQLKALMSKIVKNNDEKKDRIIKVSLAFRQGSFLTNDANGTTFGVAGTTTVYAAQYLGSSALQMALYTIDEGQTFLQKRVYAKGTILSNSTYDVRFSYGDNGLINLCEVRVSN